MRRTIFAMKSDDENKNKNNHGNHGNHNLFTFNQSALSSLINLPHPRHHHLL